jgi:hypothetical protein
LKHDPYELKNIVHDKRAAASLINMQNELRKLLVETDGK